MLQKNKTALNVSSWMLLITIFITGNVVMMLEVVGTRVVGPYFGVGLYVWSALITVTLLALAAGYWLGGKLADRYQTFEALYLIILGAALGTLLIPVLRYPWLAFTGKMGMRVGVMLGSTLLFGPPLLLLGMVSPYAVKLYTNQLEKLGTRVGLLYALSTLGSFLGTLSMGFYLIPNFRLTTILLCLGFILLLFPLVYFFILRTRNILGATMLFGILLGALLLLNQQNNFQMLRGNLQVIYKTNSFYGEIKVVETNTQRLLLVDGVTQSGENISDHTASPQYVRDMGSLISHFAPQLQTALVIGLGGGNVIHLLRQRGVKVEVVEIDPQMVRVAERFFRVDPTQVTIHLNDGRRYIRYCQQSYDLIVLNTFTGENFPSHLLTREFYQELQHCLKPQSIVVTNFVGYVQGPHRQGAAAVFATLQSAFAWCHVYFREPKDRFANILYVAGNGKTPEIEDQDPNWETLKEREVVIAGWEKAPVCTDEYNPVEFLNRVVYRRWRQLIMDALGPEILLD